MRRDPDIARALRLNWRLLPKQLRLTGANVAVIRLSLIGFVCLIVISLAQTATTSTPTAFFASLLSINSAFAVIGLISGVALLVWRAMSVAPRFIEAYSQMMPENEQEIREMFIERGVADVIAPWVMTRPGRFNAVMRRLANRFVPMP